MVTNEFYVEGSGRGRGATPLSTPRPPRLGRNATRRQRVRARMANEARARDSRQRAAAAQRRARGRR